MTAGPQELSRAPGRYESVLLAPGPPVLPSDAHGALFTHGVDGVLITSTDGRILGANAQACATLGRTEAELVALGPGDVLDRRDRRWHAALETRNRYGCFRGVVRLRRRDGESFQAEITTATFIDGDEPRAYITIREVSPAGTVSAHRQQTERDLRMALTRQELYAEYQPAFHLGLRRVDHIEALVRWRHPVRGRIAPAQFIPLAEDCGLISDVGDQVLALAVAQATRWLHVPGIRVWVNVSPQQLAQKGYPAQLAAHLDRAGLPPGRLGIEVTESASADAGRLAGVLGEVRAMGVAVAIDDFGTGYSSLARLAALPVDVVKIDRSFVSAVGAARGQALLAGIVALAHAVGASVIAEGVETTGQLAALSALGVDSASGFLLARPGPAELLPWATGASWPRARRSPAGRPRSR